MSKHGGKREGAGRPRSPEPKEQRSITLSAEVWRFVAAYGLWTDTLNDSRCIEKLLTSHPLYQGAPDQE